MYYFDLVSGCTYDHCMFEVFHALGVAKSLVQTGASTGSPSSSPSYLVFGKEIQQDLYLLNFVLGVDFLLQTSSLNRLRDSTSEEGYQRLLDKDKLRKMRDYLLEGVPAYPNNIICKLSENAEVEPIRNGFAALPEASQSVYADLLSNGVRDNAFIVRLPDSYSIFEVVDGQHRLFSFAQTKYHLFENASPAEKRKLKRGDERIAELAKKSILLVTAIYVRPGSPKQEWADSGRLFYELNTTQTKLSPEDVIDLIQRLNPEDPVAKANRLLVRLNGTGVLAKKIKLKPWQNDLIKRTSLIKYSGLEFIFSEGKKSRQILNSCFSRQHVFASYEAYCYILIENYLAAYQALLRQKFGSRFSQVEKDLTLTHYYAYSAVFIAGMIRLIRHFFSDNDRAFRGRDRVNLLLRGGTSERNTINLNIRNPELIRFFSRGLSPIVRKYHFTRSEFDRQRGWGPNKWAKIEADLFYVIADANTRRFGLEALIAKKYHR
jgi:DGQHR domain-containing protein